MLVGVAFLPPSFPPSRTQAFYIIKRQNCVFFRNRVYIRYYSWFQQPQNNCVHINNSVVFYFKFKCFSQSLLYFLTLTVFHIILKNRLQRTTACSTQQHHLKGPLSLCSTAVKLLMSCSQLKTRKSGVGKGIYGAQYNQKFIYICFIKRAIF